MGYTTGDDPQQAEQASAENKTSGGTPVTTRDASLAKKRRDRRKAEKSWLCCC